jgi:hypothetical protein
MQQIIDLGKRSLRTLWTHKALWFFGFFVAAAGMGGGGKEERGGAGRPDFNPESIPPWAWGLIAVAGVLAVVFFVFHILSEAALIEGVAEGQKGEEPGIRRGLGRSRRHFWRVLGLKVLFGLCAGLLAGVVSVPALLAWKALLPLWLGVTVTVLLAIPALPLLITLYFGYLYALRFAVLEDHGVRDAITRSRRFLHGRIGLSLKIAVLDLAGSIGGGVVMGVALIPAAILAGIGWLMGGMVPAIVLGGIVALPCGALALGALGTFRSAVWTLGFMDQHYAGQAG